jgi:aminoglycoside phosphotransferase (APT) family kinase protein
MDGISDGVHVALTEAAPGCEPQRAVLLGEGWNVTAWRVPDPGGDWTLRVPKHEEGIAELERQHCLRPVLLAAGLPGPDGWRLLRDGERAVAGLYRFVEGAAAPRRGARSLGGLAGEVAGYLRGLHAVDVEAAFACGAEAMEPRRDRYAPMLARTAPLLPERSRAYVERVYEALELASTTAPRSVLVHGDLQPDHLVCDERGGVRAVLDMSGPNVTDPAIDFGRLVQHWGGAFAAAVLLQYGGTVDGGFVGRMKAYAALEPLRTIDVALERGLPEWERWGRRRLSAAAGAETRRLGRAGPARGSG